jgi:hypothetical protein
MIISPAHTEAVMKIHDLHTSSYKPSYGEIKSIASQIPDCLGFGNDSIVVDMDEERVLAITHSKKSETQALEEQCLADILHETLRHTDRYYSPQFLSVYPGNPSIIGFPGSIREKINKQDQPALQEFIDFTNWVHGLLVSMGNYGNRIYFDMQIDTMHTPPRLGPNLIKDDKNRLTFIDALEIFKAFNERYSPINIEDFLYYASTEIPNLPDESLEYFRDRLEKLEQINCFYRCLPYQMIEVNGELIYLSALSDTQIDNLFETWDSSKNMFRVNVDLILSRMEGDQEKKLATQTKIANISSGIEAISNLSRVPYYLRNVFKEGIGNAREYAKL